MIEKTRKPIEVIRYSYGIDHANTYIVKEKNDAILIDICSNEVVIELKEKHINPEFVLLTHEHVDHIWGLNVLRDSFSEVKVVANSICSNAIGDPKKNKASQYHIYLALRKGASCQSREVYDRGYRCLPADIVFDKSFEFSWRGHFIHIVHTPGHSPASCLIILDDLFVFSGDTILEEKTFLEFDGGNIDEYQAITLPIIRGLSNEVTICPGHGEPFSMSKWKYQVR